MCTEIDFCHAALGDRLLDADLADFGSVGVSGAYSSIGWGAIDQKLAERSLESITQFDVSTTLQLGKFLGERAGVQIPFYYQYSQTIRKPKYDALDLDLLLHRAAEIVKRIIDYERFAILLLDEATEIRSLAYFAGLRQVDQPFAAALAAR